MALRDDDNEFLRQLAWIYPSDYIAEIKQLAEAVVTEQLAAGQRQNIRDIVRGIIDKNRSEDGEATIREQEQAEIRQAQAAVKRQVRDSVQAALSAGQTNIPAGMGPEGIEPLIEALGDDDACFAANARSALGRLTDSGAIDAFCSEWAGSRNAELERILLAAGYLASQPLGLRLLTVLKTGADKSMLTCGSELVPELLAAVDDDDQHIAGRARQLLLTLTDRQAIDAVCEAVLAAPDNLRLQAWAVSACYAPTGDSRAAFYYAATGQWDNYYALDRQENRPLLAKSYNEAGAAERRRLLEVVRKSGQSLLLAGLLLTGGHEEYEELTAADWEAMLDLLITEQRWTELYRLGLSAPAGWAAEIVRILANAHWLPREWERQSWASILSACPESGRRVFIPDGREIAILELDRTETVIECAAFHPDRKLVAGGGRDGRLRLWQIGSRFIWRTIDIHANAITAMAFTPDGRYLATSGQDGKVHVWRLPDVTWVCSVNGQPGLVTAMAAADSGQILAAAGGANAAVARVWDWDGTYIANQAQLPGSLFGVAAVNCQQRQAAGGGRDGKIRLYALPGCKQGKLAWQAHSGALDSLHLSGDGSSAVSTGADGLLKIWQTAEGRLLGSMPYSGRLKAVSYDGAMAAVIRQDQGVIIIKQLAFVKPLAQATPADWRHFRQLLLLSQLESDARQAVLFLSALLAAKFRYDITL